MLEIPDADLEGMGLRELKDLANQVGVGHSDDREILLRNLKREAL